MNGDGSDSSLRTAFAEALDHGDGEALAALVSDLSTASVETRKACVRSLNPTGDDPPLALDSASIARTLPAFEPLLTDEERSVRLTTAKLFVAVAEAAPGAVVPIVPALADRLADDEEFYYVRARSAEALGYIALCHPDAAGSPEVLADLRVGLSFDEPEVKEKLAKALEYVTLGNPRRLRYQVSRLAEHLDDEVGLVRYHLTTALVIIGCEFPDALAEAVEPLVARLADENAHVRGRAAEALGLLAREGTGDALGPEVLEALLAIEDESEDESGDGDGEEAEDEDDAKGGSEGGDEAKDDEEERFAVDRARFALDRIHGTDAANEAREASDEIGTVAGVRATTDEAVEAITSPDGEGCPHCGLVLGAGGPPMCPRCGAPY